MTAMMRDSGSLICVVAKDQKICMALLELSKGDVLVISGEGKPAITLPSVSEGGVTPGLIVYTDLLISSTQRCDARQAA